MRLSEVKGEDTLDVLADIIDPITMIASDEEVKVMRENGSPKLLLVKYLLKAHKSAIIEIMATINRKPIDEFKETLTIESLIKMLIELANDPLLAEVFQSQGQNVTSSGSAMESTEEEEK